MIAEQLRKSILQAAIQGKLTEQLPDDGDARDLLKEVEKEKARLIKEGKIKKEKPLPAITEDEIPFEIPDNWCWVRLGDLVINRDAERKPVSKSLRENLKKVYDYYGASGIIDKIDSYLFSEELLLIGEDGANLINRSTPIAFIATGKYWVNNHAHVLQMYPNISIEYMCFFVNAISLVEYVTGTAQPKMNQQRMNSILVAVPAEKEQIRIVNRLKELLPEIDTLSQYEAKLEALQKAFPKKMKDSILQYAIQGKLTEQIPEDGDARDLLKEIEKEKARLIKEGKIKKENPLPAITEDEIPFEIPDNWCWVRLNECLDVRDGTHDTPKYVSKGIPLVTSKNLVNGSIDFSTARLISVEDAEAINLRSKVDDGDILFAMIGSIGNPAIVRKDREFSIKNVALFKNISSLMNMRFVYYFLFCTQDVMKKVSSGGVQAFISLNFLRKSLIPIPPAVEQQRIVERLDELLPLCETLE